VEILDADQRPIRLTAPRLLLGIIVVASFGVWAYAYSGLADRPTPDLLDDPGFAAAAEARCTEARDGLDRLTPAYLATDHIDRAATVTEANRLLRSMVADLRAVPTGSVRDRQIVDAWLTDWEIYLGDREDYAVRLAADPMARFYQSDVANEHLDRRLTRLATTNQMASCGAPGDVG
jgi:hypothetical protein